jgi:hypothetical protein
MKKTSLITTSLLLGAMLLSACSAAAQTPAYNSYSQDESYAESAPMEAPLADSASGSAFDYEGKSYTDNTIAAEETVERMVIRNANLVIDVLEPEQALKDVQTLAESMQGYVVTSNLYQRSLYDGTEVFEASATIRVPAEKLDEAMSQIKALVEDPKVDVESENVSGQDVTKDYTDLQSRLRNLESASEQLQEIMKTATKAEDVLAIFNNLKEVNEEIEVIKGQMKYYEEAAALSAINVTIQAKETTKPITVAGWSAGEVAHDALQTLVDVYQWIATAAINIGIVCVPVFLPVLVIGYLLFRLIRSQSRKSKAAHKQDEAAPVPPEQ